MNHLPVIQIILYLRTYLVPFNDFQKENLRTVSHPYGKLQFILFIFVIILTCVLVPGDGIANGNYFKLRIVPYLKFKYCELQTSITILKKQNIRKNRKHRTGRWECKR